MTIIEALVKLRNDLKLWVANNLRVKMDKENPSGTGSLSINRLEDSTVGDYSSAFGYRNNATGVASVAEGYETTSNGDYSHSEGINSLAQGVASHAEGGNIGTDGSELNTVVHNIGGDTFYVGGTEASGDMSHAEGCQTLARGFVSHSEGLQTVAYGEVSHAEGVGTVAYHGQHVEGTYNEIDEMSQYLHIVGNGENLNGNITRSNAYTLDRGGNAVYSGLVRTGASVEDIYGSGDNSCITKGYSDTYLQEKLIESSTKNNSISLAPETVGTIATLKLSKGTYMIFGGASILLKADDTDMTDNFMKICLSTSTSYNNDCSGSALGAAGCSNQMNCWGHFSIAEDNTTIYLLGYHQAGTSTREVSGGRITAVRLGDPYGVLGTQWW